MNDYSKYIKTAHGFIFNYTIENGKIYIHTARSKKKKPHEYELTEENKRKYDDRLGKQYTILHENKDEIKADISKTARKVIYTFGGTVIALATAAGFVLNALGGPIIIPTIGIVISALAMFGGEIALGCWKNAFDNYIADQMHYMKERAMMEEYSAQDKNITKHISQHAQTIIKAKEDLRNKSNIHTEIFDVDFMDKISAEDLRALRNAYLISIGLEQDPKYCSPTQTKKSNIKKRARVKKEESR